ncbi:MAG: isoprenylcysteine carboxylmethyltransferase family protein [Anaerolineae bacterium]|nr:isoprenylcysteine carboxylmethyltransferase family protein [Anaerolineae bacterium]
MLEIIVLVVIFGLIHSWLAGQDIKSKVKRAIGERAYHGFYRLGYNILAAVTLLPPLILIILRGEVIWRIEGLAVGALLLIQAAGVIGLVVSLLQIDWMRFAGLRQTLAYFSGAALPLPEEPLQTGGLYGLVRHPLYLFSLMAMWPMATMTDSLLAFNIAATLYFVVGSLYEERRLVAAFGENYVAYRQRVPWLIPGLRLRN